MTATSLIHLSLLEAKKGLQEKQFSATELVQAHLEQVEKTNHINAYITTLPEQALLQAQQSDVRLKNGEGRLLEGLPIAMKDNYCTKGVRTTAASKILENFTPSYESTVSQKLLEAGTISVGKTNMDEFAMGSANLTSYFGPVKGPWKNVAGKSLVPGGSSGGSSAAVAAYTAFGATGTDTGGSIRQPAAFCGLVGIKPTYGRCSRYGIIAFASSLDQAGPITRTVEDAALMLQAMAGYDPQDSTSVDKPVPDYFAALKQDIRGLKIGIPKEYNIDGLRNDIQELWQKTADILKNKGAEIIDISLPHTKYALPVYYIIAPAEASSNLSRYDGVRFGFRAEGSTLDEVYSNSRGQGFGAEVKRRILMGTDVLSAGFYDAYYVRAQKVRGKIIQDFCEAFKQVDFILTPSTPNPAFAIGEEPKDPLTMYMNDIFTVTANLAGLPGISVPMGSSQEGLPLGMQLLGPNFCEDRLLCIAQHLFEAADLPVLPRI